ncbi:MAG TPA: hypothetical protein DDX72_06480 [Ruminococcaceae bacterium]|nr:hypothetical protein [Oscillospiraceae bacterium]
MDVEFSKILAFDKLALGKTEEEQKVMASYLGIDFEDYRKRIVGKEKEAEFIYILKALDALKHFEAYDEEFSHVTDEYTPDFKVELRDGNKMLLEVKHTGKDYYKISQGNLEKRIAFADRQQLPLRIAVSIKGMWGLFTTETLKKHHGKLSYEDFIGPKSVSWFDSELETCSYMFNKPVKIVSVYSNNHSKGMGIRFDPYGELISYKLFYNDRLIFRAKGKDSGYLKFVFILEALQDRLSIINQNIEQDNNYTIITEYSNVFQSIPEYNFLISPVNHIIKDESRVNYNLRMAISEKSFPLFTITELRSMFYYLASHGLDILLLKNNSIYPFLNYANNAWNSSK